MSLEPCRPAPALTLVNETPAHGAAIEALPAGMYTRDVLVLVPYRHHQIEIGLLQRAVEGLFRRLGA